VACSWRLSDKKANHTRKAWPARFPPARTPCGGQLPSAQVAGSSGPLVFRSLVKCAVDLVAQGVCGLAGQCLVQVAEDDAHEEVLLPRLRAEAADRGRAQLLAGGGGKHPDLLDAARAGAEGIADAVAEGFLIVVPGDGE